MIAAIFEVATGLALVIAPAVAVSVLLGAEVSGVALALGRVAGLGLFSFGVACWPTPAPTVPALLAMLCYNSLAAAYLAYLRFAGDFAGVLLIPALVLHAVLAFMFAWAWFKSRSAS